MLYVSRRPGQALDIGHIRLVVEEPIKRAVTFVIESGGVSSRSKPLRQQQDLPLGDNITVTVIRVARCGKVDLGVHAPESITISRPERQLVSSLSFAGTEPRS